jgi:hypothetical protein
MTKKEAKKPATKKTATKKPSQEGEEVPEDARDS